MGHKDDGVADDEFDLDFADDNVAPAKHISASVPTQKNNVKSPHVVSGSSNAVPSSLGQKAVSDSGTAVPSSLGQKATTKEQPDPNLFNATVEKEVCTTGLLL
jgi:hypothetical protein